MVSVAAVVAVSAVVGAVVALVVVVVVVVAGWSVGAGSLVARSPSGLPWKGLVSGCAGPPPKGALGAIAVGSGLLGVAGASGPILLWGECWFGSGGVGSRIVGMAEFAESKEGIRE